MNPPAWTRSFKSRIVWSYSLILILGGASTTSIGTWVTSKLLREQALRDSQQRLSVARSLLDERLQQLRQSIEFAALSHNPPSLAGSQTDDARSWEDLRVQLGLDFLRRVGLSRIDDERAGVATPPALRHAAAGVAVRSVEVLSPDQQQWLCSASAEPVDGAGISAARLSLFAAAPVLGANGEILSVVCGGQFLDSPGEGSSPPLLQHLRAVLFAGPSEETPSDGTVFVCRDDTVTSTAAISEIGRQPGAVLSADVIENVLRRGERRLAREFTGGVWRDVAYAPLVNASNAPVGAIGVETAERPYMVIRDTLTACFLAIALLCFVLIVVVTYFLTRSLVRPLDEMVFAARKIAGGDLSPRVRVDGHTEFVQVGRSFNEMLDRIHAMTGEVEGWARSLESRVEQRTRELENTRTQMARSERLASVGRLAAGVAHEINNPLGGVLTFASLVQEGLPESDPLREDVQEIVRQAIRCRQIVAELLEFSRQRPPQMQPENLNQVATQVLALLERQAAFHNIVIERHLDPDLPDACMDSSQMEQVLINIILNAADAMNEAGTLTIRTWAEAREVCVQITDTGCGIPPDRLDAIFDPFYTTKDPGKGTGLGLAVAHRIVSDHGGHIDVDSETGQGTSMTVRMPRPREHESTPPAPLASAQTLH